METQSLKIEIGEVDENLLNQLSDMFIEHWDEVAKNKHLMVLKPDVNKYLQLQKAGNLLTLIAYVDNKIVGYSCNIRSPHLHYADLICMYNDVLFIDKNYRATPLGLRLIKRTEEEAKNMGAQLMLWHAKQGSALDKILPRLKCKVQEIMYSKEL